MNFFTSLVAIVEFVMKIVLDISYFQIERAGYGHHTTELLNTLLNYDRENEYILWGWSFSIDKKAVCKFARENVVIKLSKIPGFIKRFYFNKLKFPDVKYIVGDYDIFHSCEPLMPPIKNKKSIITIHDLAYKKFPNLFQSQVLKWDKIIAQNVYRTDSIIVPSEQTKNDVINAFKVPEDMVNAIYLPVDDKFYHSIDKLLIEKVKEKYKLLFPFILFVGTIEPRKNITVLIEAFEKLHKLKKLELHLVLVGKLGWYYKPILDRISKSSIKNKIHLLHYIPLDDLVAIYRLAEFLVYPSIYEGYGVPVLEAMASGTAVITSRSSSLIEIAGDSALFFEPSDSDKLRDAILNLCEDTNLKKNLINKGLERIKKFDRKTAAEKILSIYKRII